MSEYYSGKFAIKRVISHRCRMDRNINHEPRNSLYLRIKIRKNPKIISKPLEYILENMESGKQILKDYILKATSGRASLRDWFKKYPALADLFDEKDFEPKPRRPKMST